MKITLRNTLFIILLLISPLAFGGGMGNMGGNMGMGGGMGGMGMGMGGPGVPINDGIYILLIAGLIYGIKVLYKNPKKQVTD